MWADLEAWAMGPAPPRGWDVIAVNRAGLLYQEPIRCWCSIHGVALVDWIEERRQLGCDMNFQAFGNFTRFQDSGSVERWNCPNWGGTSSAYAVDLALKAGWDRVVLCGVPMAGNESLGVDEILAYPTGYEVYRIGWEKHYDEIKDKVRSMSGWTRELLGEPTEEWLES
jgi:hypothetical protein